MSHKNVDLKKNDLSWKNKQKEGEVSTGSIESYDIVAYCSYAYA